jgi:hypothetical protein
MQEKEKLKERIANINKLEKSGEINEHTAKILRADAEDILSKISGDAPQVEADKVIEKIKSMRIRPFLGLKGVNTREELEPNAVTRETTPKGNITNEAQKTSLEKRMSRENAIMASILSKAVYSDVLAKPGPGMIKPNDMTRMFGIEIPGKVGELSMGIPRNALTEEEMEFLINRNTQMTGG